MLNYLAMFHQVSQLSTVIFWPGTSINVMPMKKVKYRHPILIVAKAQHQHPVPRLQSKLVISVSNRVYLVTDVILVVSK